jgi:hypothetical protein
MSEFKSDILARYWESRFRAAERAFRGLKDHTKRHPAGLWTPEYRELADLIHSLGRKVFYVGIIKPVAKGSV